MMRQLPLATLFTFEVAARHLNFTKTADEGQGLLCNLIIILPKLTL